MSKSVSNWTGRGKKPEESDNAGPSSSNAEKFEPVRQGLKRMGTWGFRGGEKDGAKQKTGGGDHRAEEEEEDDKHIRFTIGGRGQRLTKEDFLKEIQSLDPKARCEVISDSNAPPAMKTMAKQDANAAIPGSSRLYHAKDVQMASGSDIASTVGAKMAKIRGAKIDDEDPAGEISSSPSLEDLNSRKSPKNNPPPRPSSSGLTTIESSKQIPETEAERKRREQALKGVDDVTPAQRGRTKRRDTDDAHVDETPAERRRRLAALGSAGVAESDEGRADEDSDDDDTPRVPPPAAKSRGIRFAQSPVRGRK